MRVKDIMLADLNKTQEIDLVILRGLHWDGARDLQSHVFIAHIVGSATEARSRDAISKVVVHGQSL
jgi:hypothetical protein